MKKQSKQVNEVKHKFLETSTKEDCVDLATISNIVKRHSGTIIPLVKPKSYCMRVCGQDDTVYAKNEDVLEAWKDFYLPERKDMEVIAAIDDFPCDAFGLQLVLMLCEDGNVYAYEDEVLHLVARNLKELFTCGLVFPGIETFKLGECFEDCTEEEYSEIMQSTEIKEMKEAHRAFRESLELELLQSLKNFKDQIKGELPVKTSNCKDVVVQSSQMIIVAAD